LFYVDSEEEEEEEGGENMDTIEEEGASEAQVFVPGTSSLKEGEELVHDGSTYHMYHVVSV
jgi:hypothetical protein